MLSRFRSLFFLLFVSVFFITAASVIFYTFGYRFSFERGIFIYTGSLSLKTNVETVDIKIDNELIPKKRLGLLNNSIHIPGLSPGEHFVEVSAPGYRPWAKKIVVQSGLTTEFWNILLSKEASEVAALPHSENIIKMFPAPNGLFAVVKKNNTTYSVETLDIQNEENEQVFFTSDTIFSTDSKTNIEWAPESHKIVIPLTQDGNPLYAIVNIRTKEVIYLNTLTNISTPLLSPRWDATARDFLFFLHNSALYRIDTASVNPVLMLIKENVAAYEISGNYLYYLSNENGVVYQIPGNGAGFVPKQITPAPAEIDTRNSYTLIAYDEERLAIIEEPTGVLTVFNKLALEQPLKEIGNSVVGIQYSDDGKKLLYYTNHEIFVYFNQEWKTQPVRARDTTIQVGRFSTPIKNVGWAEDYEHVIFSLNNQIKMIELDNRDRRDLSDLMTLNATPLQLLSRFGEDSIYIVKEKLSDAPEKTALGMSLPQIATFFGF